MNRLWLAVHLPWLPLEARATRSPPSALVERDRVVLADEAARLAGVVNGTRVAVARMLVPTITLVARDGAQEAAAMHALACWTGNFTPHVSLADDTLLLEVGSCLRLFGGVEQIAEAVANGIRAQDFHAEMACAPTPLAAQWLARCATAAFCTNLQSMQRWLTALPVDVLPGRAAPALERFGAHTLGDVRRLPTAALARRIGVEALQAMARAFGELADPRADFVFPERFAITLPLPAAVDSAPALLFAARRLCAALAGWLSQRQAGVREFVLTLTHRQGQTPLRIQLAAATADTTRFERVLRERLEQLTLNAPVEALQLEADAPSALPRRSRTLFDDAQGSQEALGALLERLSARLGQRQVYRIDTIDEHRPEYATSKRPALSEATNPGAGQTAFTAPPRPLWLLDPPQTLVEIDGRPQRDGALQLIGGPERIESGWWDSGETRSEALDSAPSEQPGQTALSIGDIRRDYFIAIARDGSWLWIYRDCRPPGGWYAHGIFS